MQQASQSYLEDYSNSKGRMGVSTMRFAFVWHSPSVLWCGGMAIVVGDYRDLPQTHYLLFSGRVRRRFILRPITWRICSALYIICQLQPDTRFVCGFSVCTQPHRRRSKGEREGNRWDGDPNAIWTEWGLMLGTVSRIDCFRMAYIARWAEVRLGVGSTREDAFLFAGLNGNGN